MLTVNSKSVHQAGCSPACPSTVSVPPVWATATLPLQEAVETSRLVLAQSSHQIAAFPLGPCVLRLCMCLLGVSLYFPQSTGLLTVCPVYSPKPDVQGTHLPSAGLQAEESDMRLQNCPVRELLQPNYFPVCGSPTWGVWDLIILWICPSCSLVVPSWCFSSGSFQSFSSVIVLQMWFLVCS